MNDLYFRGPSMIYIVIHLGFREMTDHFVTSDSFLNTRFTVPVAPGSIANGRTEESTIHA